MQESRDFDSGRFRYGYWYADFSSVTKLDQGNELAYKIGTASNRIDSQYTVSFNYDSIIIESEIFGISPVYYAKIEGEFYFSSSLNLLNDKIKKQKNLHINQSYLLELCLFNYALFDNTIYKEIKLVPANCRVIITDQIKFIKCFNIEDFFKDSPISYNECINDLADLFISITTPIFSNRDYLSFTSGFDGRSLLAIALNSKKDIHTYSFGKPGNDDFDMPLFQSRLLNLRHKSIELGSQNYLEDFLKQYKEILTFLGPCTSLLQMHWPYAAKLLSKKCDTIITGLFGSELFRAVHLEGQFCSTALFNYFKYMDVDKWVTTLKTSDSLQLLNLEVFKDDFESVIAELYNYRNTVKHLTTNQRFYKFIFEEIFRKFFGSQIIQPMRLYTKVVNPFLNWQFIKELLKTELAGVNNDFFSENPLKRFKGQLFYAHLIRKTHSKLLIMPTGKGYSPIDLLTTRGKIKIGYSFYKKRTIRKLSTPYINNLGIISALNYNMPSLLIEGVMDKYFMSQYCNSLLMSPSLSTNEKLRDNVVKLISINYWMRSAL